MLGEQSSLSGVDFNQTLYLGVEIGGTSTPAWDGEMSPRKILGAVPVAFYANTTDSFSGLATTSFLRSDQADIASGVADIQWWSFEYCLFYYYKFDDLNCHYDNLCDK